MQSNKQTSKNTTKETQTISNRRTDIILACFEACDKRLLEFLFFCLNFILVFDSVSVSLSCEFCGLSLVS